MPGLKHAIWFAAFVVLTMPLACKDSAENTAGGGGEAPSVDSLEGSEDDLLARRDSLLAARSKVRNERSALDAELKQAQAKGGDTAALVARRGQLEAEEERISEQEVELNKSLDSYLKERRALLEQLATQASAQNRAATSQTLVASREKDLASRESRLADREATLAAREAILAKREKETCGVGGGTTIIQTAAPKGSSYRKADVAPMLRRARREMSKKGILKSDLPAAVRGLEQEATKAMAKGDYGRAHFAAGQLLASVRGLRVDKGFIAAKIGRLNQRIKGKKLGAAKDAEVSKLFRQATANFGDGRFKSANGRLNKISAVIR